MRPLQMDGNEKIPRSTLSKRTESKRVQSIRNKHICVCVCVFVEYIIYVRIAESSAVGQPIGSCHAERGFCTVSNAHVSRRSTLRRRRRPETVTLRTRPRIVLVPRDGGDGGGGDDGNIHCVVGRGTTFRTQYIVETSVGPRQSIATAIRVIVEPRVGNVVALTTPW